MFMVLGWIKLIKSNLQNLLHVSSSMMMREDKQFSEEQEEENEKICLMNINEVVWESKSLLSRENLLRMLKQF